MSLIQTINTLLYQALLDLKQVGRVDIAGTITSDSSIYSL
jgi:hypothetical protein